MMSNSLSDAHSLAKPLTPLVLITDDDEAYRAVVCANLKAAGFRALQASNEQDCLRAYMHHCPDLVLLDLEMPEKDGLQCLRELRSLAGDGLSPVLILSATNQAEVMEQAFEAGAADFITKLSSGRS